MKHSRAKVTSTLRLIDESGLDTDAVCRLFSFGTPAQPITLNTTSVQMAFEIDPPGGLFEARHGEFTDTIIVSPPIKGGLEGLAAKPDLGELNKSGGDLFELLSLLALWSKTRAVGPLIGIRHARVLQRLYNCLYSELCGKNWAQAEDCYLSNPAAESALRRLIHSVGEPYGFAAVLRREFDRMEAGKEPGVRWFTQVAARYHNGCNEGFCEFALRVSSVPHQLLRWPRVALEPLFNEIKERAVLLRGARLVALLCATADPNSDGMPVPRWQW